MHKPLVIDGDPERIEAHLPMIHIAFSNLKSWLLGTHHGVHHRHFQAYLNEFVFRFRPTFLSERPLGFAVSNEVKCKRLLWVAIICLRPISHPAGPEFRTVIHLGLRSRLGTGFDTASSYVAMAKIS